VGRVLKDLIRVGKIGRRTAVLGNGGALEHFLHRVAVRKGQLMAVSAVYGPASPFGGPPVWGYPLAGGFQDLLQAARQELFDDIVIAFPDSESAQATEAIETLRELPVDVYIAPQVTGLGRRMRPVYHEGDLPMFEVWQRPISGWDRFLKLALDYLIAGIALLLLLPALALIAVAIRADSRGPVLFRQTRLGFNNREFEIYKFRTMRQRDDAKSDVLQATRHDPRVTRVGWFLRRTSLDELPQLLNVLNGTMSLVGPRPHALSHNADFSNVVRGYFGRHKVKPGITGWAQVNGLRGEIDCDEKLKARIAHDVHYAENWSIYLDLRILFTTAFVVLFQKNAY
jgi:Undecaprenyl-phosphate glucose phosphotransferase